MNKKLSQLRKATFLLVPLVLGTPTAHSAADASRAGNPNVIIIYSDDHGYTDLGLFGIDSNVAANSRPKRTSPARDFGRMFKRLDENNDGFVTLREFIGDRREKSAALTKMFKKRDANNDSRLTVEEIHR